MPFLSDEGRRISVHEFEFESHSVFEWGSWQLSKPRALWKQPTRQPFVANRFCPLLLISLRRTVSAQSMRYEVEGQASHSAFTPLLTKEAPNCTENEKEFVHVRRRILGHVWVGFL
jgi:hypothetical protein